MKKNTLIVTVFCFLGGVPHGVAAAPPASAANCGDLLAEARGERELLEKRNRLERALAVCPNHAEIVYEYGYSQERLRKYETAVTHYEHAITLDPTLAKAFFGLGDVQHLLGKEAESIQAFEKGLAMAPDNSRAKRSLAEARKQLAQKPPVPATRPATDRTEEMSRTPGMAQEGPAGYGYTRPQPPAAESTRPLPQTEHGVLSQQPADPTALLEPAAAARQELALVRDTVIQFDTFSGSLSPQAKTQLDSLGRAMASPPLLAESFEIGGHSDTTGTLPANMALSRQRAEMVKQYLVGHHRIDPDRLIPVAYGPSRPLSPNSSPESRAVNRRADFSLLTEYQAP